MEALRLVDGDVWSCQEQMDQYLIPVAVVAAEAVVLD